MKKHFIDRAMDLRHIVIFVISILVLTGIYALVVMPKNEFPTVTMPQGLIVGVYPGASSSEVEEQLTKPLEKFIFGFKEFKKSEVVSSSRDGIVYTMVQLDDEVKAEERSIFWSRFKHNVSLFKSSLPSGVLAIVVMDDFGESSALLMAMESDNKTYPEMEGYMDDLMARLRKVNAVSNLKVYGLQKEQFSVYLNQDKMSAYSLNTATVATSLMASGNGILGTSVTGSAMKAPIYVESPLGSEDDLAERIIYYSPDGKIVRLKDVAEIRREFPEPDSYVRSNGKKAIILSLEMKNGNNIVQMGRDVTSIIDEFKEELPDDVSIYPITDQAQVVRDSVNEFLGELLIAILSVVLVVILLLPLKVALVSASSIPITIFMSLAVFYLCGIELNTVSLAALIMTLGMIVDNSIVIVDSYLEKLDHGIERRKAAADSAKQFLRSIFAATLAISVTFMPFIITTRGIISDFIGVFPWATSIILFLSLLIAIALIPTMQYAFIRKGLGSDNESLRSKVTGSVQNFFDKIISFSFRRPGTTVIIASSLLLLGFLLFAVVPIKMMPVAQRNQFAAEIYLQNGSTLEQTAAVANKLENLLKQDEQVVSITSFIGSSSPRFHTAYAPQMPGTNYAQFIVNTTSNEATDILLDVYSPLVRDMFPEAVIKFKQLEYNAAANPVEIRLTCSDRDTLKKYSMMVEQAMRKVDDLEMVRTDLNGTVPAVTIVPDMDAMDRLGIQSSAVSLHTMAKYSGGLPVGSVYEDGTPVNIVLKSGRDGKPDVNTVGDERIAGFGGIVSVPLRDVADIEAEWFDGQLVRRNGVPSVTVMAGVGRGLNSTVALRKAHAEISKLNIPSYVTVENGGDASFSNEVIPQMVNALVLSLVIILLILLFHFKHLKTSILVLGAIVIFTLPCTTISIMIMGYDLSVTCFMGIVSLMGIIARNAIIMIDYANELMLNGESVKDAVEHSAHRRMRPIFLTSAAASMGVIPMILGGSTLWAPMGVVVFIGTWLSMFLILTMFPVLYSKIASNPKEDDLPSDNGRKMKKAVAIAVTALIIPAFTNMASAADTLSVRECVALALKNNAKIKNGALDVGIADETRKQAFTAYFPKISAVGLGFYANDGLIQTDVDISAIGDFLKGMGIDPSILGIPSSIGINTLDRGALGAIAAIQPVFVGGQIVNGNKLSKIGKQVAEMQLKMSENEVCSNTEQYFYTYSSLREKKSVLESATELLDDIHVDVSSAVEAGVALKSDMLKVEIQQQNIARQRLKLTNGMTVLKLLLAQYIGAEDLDFELDTTGFHSIEMPADLFIPSDKAVEARVEASLLDRGMEAVTLQRKMTVGKYLPTVAVGGAYNGIFLQKKQYGTLLGIATVAIPISDWWAGSHEIRSSKMKEEKMRNDHDEKMGLLVVDIESKWSNLTESFLQIGIAEQTVLSAEENLSITRDHFEAGVSLMRDLLEAETICEQAKSDLVDAIVAYHQAKTAYLQATGR